jgi:SOS-response transcriptional repressor LexA
MQQIAEDQELIRSLVDWAEGGVASRVAKKIGVAASTINRHYNGTAVTKLGRETIAKLREVYPDFPGWAPTGNIKLRSEVAHFGDRPFDEKYGSGELPDIPVVGSAIGMTSFDPERHIELTEVDMGDVLDHVRRPASLARDSEAYALTVVGDSMWPRFRPGRRVIVSPKAPVSIGDDVIVQLRGGTVQTATNKDQVTTVLIKELVRRSSSYIELRQFNPDITFQVPAEQVAAIHKVIGEVF